MIFGEDFKRLRILKSIKTIQTVGDMEETTREKNGVDELRKMFEN